MAPRERGVRDHAGIPRRVRSSPRAGLGANLRPSLIKDASALKKGKKTDAAVVKLGEESAVPDLTWLAGVVEARVDGARLASLARACGPFVGRDPARPQFGNVALTRYGRAVELRAGDGHGECKGVVYHVEIDDDEVPLAGDEGCALPGSALKRSGAPRRSQPRQRSRQPTIRTPHFTQARRVRTSANGSSLTPPPPVPRARGRTARSRPRA